MSDRIVAIERLVVELGAAFQQRAVYPSGHPQVQRSIERAIAAHRTLLDGLPGALETTLLAVEGQLLVDHQPLPEEATWSRGLLQGIGRHGLSGITLLDGLDSGELSGFLDRCQSAEGPSASRHILIGRVGFALDVADAATAQELQERPAGPPLARTEELAAGRTDFASIGVGAAAGGAPAGAAADTGVDRLRTLVGALARAAAGARLESPRLSLATPADREFAHGMATALGTLRLARALGLEADALTDLGLAALLHDVGRLEAGATGGAAGLRAHPVLGAARIAAIPGAPAVAILVAYEHHLRVDGVANYPALPETRAPSAATRIVAVADTWATLRGQGRLPAAEAARMLRERSGSYLDPALVLTFTALLEAPEG